MRRPQRRLNASGFTIIEVLIVLAVAGMILLIVFEAVPALLRSSRNNQRRQDVSTILGAVSHYELNNSGAMPPNCGHAAQPSCTNSFLKYSKSKLSYFDPDTVTYAPLNDKGVIFSNGSPGNGGTSWTVSTENVLVTNYEKCLDDPDRVGVADGQGAGFNDIVALYSVETGGGLQGQCQQL
jgi:prepilin-type N-terminal cleavage/methylation domain-containing protein